MESPKPSLASAARDLSESAKSVIRSEIRLAGAELREAGGSVLGQFRLLAIAGAVAALGLLALVAFLVIGLGRLLGDCYWLSALIIGAALAATGGIAALVAFSRMKAGGIGFPTTRDSMAHQLRTVERGLHDLTLTQPDGQDS